MKIFLCSMFIPLLITSLAVGAELATAKLDEAVKIVGAIQKADYDGDRAALLKLHDQLVPYAANDEIAARVRYWLGFAFWRRAINGFNEPTDPKELDNDLQRAMAEFQQATAKDGAFADAKIGTISCLGFLMFLHRDEPPRVQELMQQVGPITHELLATAPDNPRLAWVLGGGYWFIGAERGGGQEKAIATYEKALPFARKRKSEATDPLEPVWGEPELLMSLAWSFLNHAKPDLAKAEQNARAALELVPHWHYVRDILMPQIRQAASKATPMSGGGGAP